MYTQKAQKVFEKTCLEKKKKRAILFLLIFVVYCFVFFFKYIKQSIDIKTVLLSRAHFLVLQERRKTVADVKKPHDIMYRTNIFGDLERKKFS